MRYFYLDPEVAGGLGRHTAMDVRAHPPIVKKLNYEFECWLGDVILESFPCFIVTAEAGNVLIELGATGIELDRVEITTSDMFKELNPDKILPSFVWMRVLGKAGRDDFGISEDYRLVVSQRALNALKPLGVSYALVEPFR
jgi:hypothetical protein